MAKSPKATQTLVAQASKRCIAGFQTCVPCLFNDASELVDTPLFMGVFTSLSKWLLISERWQTRGGTGHWPVPSGDPPDGTGEALFLPAETVSHRAPRPRVL
jgi:hypothetical protein